MVFVLANVIPKGGGDSLANGERWGKVEALRHKVGNEPRVDYCSMSRKPPPVMSELIVRGRSFLSQLWRVSGRNGKHTSAACADHRKHVR